MLQSTDHISDAFWFQMTFSSMKSVIDRYNKSKEEPCQLGSSGSDVKVFINIFEPICLGTLAMPECEKRNDWKYYL